MTQVSQQLKSAIGKQMTSAMANNYNAHGDVDSVADFMMSSNQLKKEVQEDDEQGLSSQISKTNGLTPEVLTKILTKIAKDVEEEEKSKEEAKEATGAGSAGGYSAPLFGKPQKRKIKERDEKIKGGLADGMSLEDLAEYHDTDVQTIIEKMEKGVRYQINLIGRGRLTCL